MKHFPYHRVIPALVIVALLILLFFAVPRFVAPRQGHLTLLTVSEFNGTRTGGTADIYLVVRPGSGNVYFATFPFTKLDTQISTRFANEVGCSLARARCEEYDFFYTIEADSTIVGGPSAGAAIAALTAAVLDRKEIDQGVAVTGTVSSGGIIGPVGGVQDKVLAASVAGLHTVVVPRWEEDDGMAPLLENASIVPDIQNGSVQNGSVTMVSSNSSLPAESFFDNVSVRKPNVTVIRAATVAEVIAVLTGEPAVGPDVGSVMVIPAEYQDTMRSIASQLCDRGDQLLEQVSRSTPSNDSLLNLSRDFLQSASLAGQDGFYYSQASYCFSANLRLRELQLSGFSESRVQNLAAEVDVAIKAAQENLSARRIATFTGLQTKAIVDERLREAALYLDAGKSSGNHSSRDVAYAMERYRSAVIWSVFFDRGSDTVELDGPHLQEACETKIAEVEERRSYLSVLTDDAFALERAPLEEAYVSRDEGDFALCLARAAKAKAEADVVISSIALDEESLDGMTRVKLDVARDIIQREAAQGRFPVMGYSYAEYAASLIEDDPFTAALFSSYALELSDLSIYFPRPKDLSGQVASVLLQPFMLGVFVGVLGMMLYLFAVHPSRKGPSHPRRR